MPKICYTPRTFSAGSMELIDKANEIIGEYDAQGFQLTLRQLYYQFVARDLIRNKQTEYKRLGSVINDARLAGLIDWYAIEDRTRSLRGTSHWDTPADVIKSAAQGYRMDKWASQKVRVEVWIEKDALAGVIAGVCRDLDVPYFSCRGYTSQSEMWAASQRLLGYARLGQASVILHLGDHDPSGIDMSRDIEDRIRLFMGRLAKGFVFRRLALNEDQVEQYDPPPNPVKLTDSRAPDYEAKYGSESWELDALEPRVLAALIRDNVQKLRVKAPWDRAVDLEDTGRMLLATAAKNWEPIAAHIDESYDLESPDTLDDDEAGDEDEDES